jgi:probable phosphoglycerate mutase
VYGKIRGTQNVPLNDTGQDQARELAEFFEDIPISAIYSDDLDRTYHTAIAIGNAKDITVVQDPNIRSWDIGADLEGLSIDRNEADVKELKQQPAKVPVGGESWGAFSKKVTKAFDRYVRKALSAPAPIVLVLHGSDLQVIYDYLEIMEAGHEYDSTPIEPSGVIALYMTRDGYSAKVLRLAKEAVDA